MKSLITLLSLLIVFAANAYEMPLKPKGLYDKKVYLGIMKQETNQLGIQSYLLTRVSSTPKKVEIFLGVNTLTEVCKRREVVRHPGVAWPHEKRRRRTTYNGGYIQEVSYDCVEWATEFIPLMTRFKLNFKEAKKLKPGEFEQFKLTVVQKDIYSKGVALEAEVSKSDVEYSFERVKRIPLLRKQALKFIAE